MGDLTKNFSRSEFACKCGCGFDTIDFEILTALQTYRDVVGPIKINSACRCESHNKAVGGGKNSQHLLGRAVDIKVKDRPPWKIQEDWVNWKGGLGHYETFTHIDSRGYRARW